MIGDILPSFLPNQRWFAGKEQGLASVAVRDQASLGEDDGTALMTMIDTTLSDGEEQRYLLPLAVTWENKEDPAVELLPYALARARRVHRVGVLHDALADASFTAAVVEAMRRDRRVTDGSRRHGRLPARRICWPRNRRSRWTTSAASGASSRIPPCSWATAWS